MDRLKDLEDKIASAIEKVKQLKDEKKNQQLRIDELERALSQKGDDLVHLQSERESVREQVEELLSELESLEI